jgi:PAS domain S-box-containing protein
VDRDITEMGNRDVSSEAISMAVVHELPAVTRTFATATADMLAAILDQSADCIKVIGPAGQVDFMNRNGRCAMEIDDFSQIAGRDWWDLWPEESRHLIHESVRLGRAGKDSRFEAFCPTAKGSPRWWDVTVSPLRDAAGEVQGLVSISRDITDKVRATELRDTAAAEMRHRLQNAYALTGAIINAAARGSPEREVFAGELQARLARLGIAQSLLLDADKFGTADLTNVVARLTEPFCPDNCVLTIADLPDIVLPEDDVRTLALVLGELSTNSNKYGAQGHGGSIVIDGTLADGSLLLRWGEELGDTAHQVGEPTTGSGNGHRLVQRALASRGGDLAIDWRPTGLDARIRLPLR